ncbi:MAG: DUF1062 domain-containing protein [Kiloniellaceae bacterium]
MVDSLSVLWTIVPQFAPQPHLHCSRCGGAKPFSSSERFRVNANGRRIDAWLIYKCAACDNTWNRPVLERTNIASVDPLHLAALQSNDPRLARRIAFDIDGLRHTTQRIDESPDVLVRKDLRSAGTTPVQRLEIGLAVPEPTRLRLDRLLATELGLPRKRVHRLHAENRLAIASGSARMLRRPLRDGTCLTLDLSRESDRIAISLAARPG